MGGQALAQLPVCRVSARQGILHPAQPPPSLGHPRLREGPGTVGQSDAAPLSPTGRQTTVFSCIFVRRQTPSNGVCWGPQNKGCRQVVFSSHQPPLFAGKKEALCLETAATPTKTGTGHQRKRNHAYIQDNFARNGINICHPW